MRVLLALLSMSAALTVAACGDGRTYDVWGPTPSASPAPGDVAPDRDDIVNN